MALTGPRHHKYRLLGKKYTLAQLTGTTIYDGAFVVQTAAGYARNAITGTGLKCVGMAFLHGKPDSVNAGASGAVSVDVYEGIFPAKNSAPGADAVLATTQVGTTLYVVDDDTVALTNGSSTRSVAGEFYELGADGTVWLSIGKV